MALFSLLLAGGAARAATIVLTLDGQVEDTIVAIGDPCGTGDGPGVCNGLPIAVEWRIDTALAPPDADPSPTIGYFEAGAGSPVFLSMVATINGRETRSTGLTATSQVVWTNDDFDFVGLQVEGKTSATIQTQQFLTRLYLPSGTLSGDSLLSLAIPFSGTPFPTPPEGGFLYEDASVKLGLNFSVANVTLPAPTPAPAAGAAIGSLALLNATRRTRRHARNAIRVALSEDHAPDPPPAARPRAGRRARRTS